MILGQYPASIYMSIASITTLITLIIIYWVSQYYGHDKPFPHAWISDVACHFPEYVFFRTATISGSTLLVLGWLTNHFYIQTVGYQKVINIHKYKPSIMLIMGIMGAFLLMGSTANLDTGKRNQKWHQQCASKFFIFTVFAQLYNTAIFSHLYFVHKAVSKTTTYLKLLQLALIIIQAFATQKTSLYARYSGDLDVNDAAYDDTRGIFLEWTLTLTVLFGFYVMGMDVKNFKFVYENYKMQEQRRNSQISLEEMN